MPRRGGMLHVFLSLPPVSLPDHPGTCGLCVELTTARVCDQSAACLYKDVTADTGRGDRSLGAPAQRQSTQPTH